MDPVIPPSSPGRPATRGLVGEFLGLLGSIGEHLQALFALAGLETKEALGLYVRAAIFLVIALVLVIFGYAFFILFVAFALAALFGVAWIWITLGLAGLHVAGTIGCLLYVKARVKTPVFATTSVELRKDFESLKNFKA